MYYLTLPLGWFWSNLEQLGGQFGLRAFMRLQSDVGQGCRHPKAWQGRRTGFLSGFLHSRQVDVDILNADWLKGGLSFSPLHSRRHLECPQDMAADFLRSKRSKREPQNILWYILRSHIPILAISYCFYLLDLFNVPVCNGAWLQEVRLIGAILEAATMCCFVCLEYPSSSI